jgi:hypothetical protein
MMMWFHSLQARKGEGLSGSRIAKSLKIHKRAGKGEL